MPNARDVDHHDTASYIPLYHRTGGFTGDERDIYKSLVYRLFHEGRVVLPDFLEDEPNLRPTFRAIGFDCLLDIDEQICPVFVLQFYKSFRLIRNLNGTICVRFTIDNVETILTLENFAQILRIPCEGVCLYSHEWSFSSLQRSLDPHPNLYPHPTKEPSLVRDALFKERPELIIRKIKGDNETLKPFQMLNTEFKDTFKKWYLILNENVICLTGHKDHPNVSLCYMLYCLSIGKRFNLAYYIVHRMMSVTQSSQMTLPYAMLLTRLFKHVQINHPHPLPNEFNLVDHVMIPLSNKRKNRIKTKGKRPRLPTPTPSNSSGSSQSPHNQGTSTNPSSDPIDNYTLDPMAYLNQLPPIQGGESPEFKQTKGLFKCLFHFLCKKK
ncbi:hypothetical protein Tco_1033978 [Tanacetum coccineum]